MSEVPEGWSAATLGDVVDVLDSRRIPVNAAERALRPGDVPYYGATGQVGWINEALFDEELVLLGEDGAPFLDPSKPKAYLINGPSWVNNHAHVLRAMPGATTNRFLKHALDAADFRPHVNGTTRLKLTQKAMNSMPIPLPPRAEQKRIVAAIEEHLSRLDAAESAVKSAELRVKAFDRTILAQAQGEGDEIDLGDLLDDIEAGKSFKTPGRKAEPGEWGVIKVSAMTWGEFDEDQNKAVPPDQPVDPRYEIRPGDLLLSRANTSEYVGATVLVRSCRPLLLLSDKSMRLLTRVGVDRRWLRLALGSPQLRAQMSHLATGTSDSMRNISQAKVRSLRIRVPSHVRQAELAGEIDGALRMRGRLEADLRLARSRAASFRRSILAAAFSGQLVPQDPNDEPASVLLDRIRAERAAAAPVRRSRKTTA